MNKYSLLIIGLIVCLFSLATVSATLSTDLSSNQVNLGGLSQEASDYNDDPVGVYDTQQITFGTDKLLSISVSELAPYKQSSSTVVNNINVTITNQDNTSGNTTITISGRIPEALPAVDVDGIAKAFKVAELTFNDGSDTVTVDLYMQRKSKLVFDEIEMKFGDDSEKLSDGETVNNLMPGDKVTVEFIVENKFPSSSNIDMDDVNIYIEDDNNDLDINEDESMGVIRDDDTDTESISIDIDNGLDEGNYDLLLWVTGEDDYGARHGELYTVTIEIEKEKDDLSLKRVDLNPDSVNLCESRMVSLTVSMENIGKNDQDEAAISVQNSNLGYYNIIGDLEIDEDDAKTKTFSISVPRTASAGTYQFLVSAINDDGDTTDEESISLIVTACSGTTSTTLGQQITTSAAPQNVQLLTPSISDVTSAQPPAGHIDFTTKKEGQNDLPIVILVVIIGIILAAIIILIALLVR